MQSAEKLQLRTLSGKVESMLKDPDEFVRTAAVRELHEEVGKLLAEIKAGKEASKKAGDGADVKLPKLAQLRAKLAGKCSFPLAYDPAGKLPPAAKTRQQMSPEEIKTETARAREFYAKTISMRIGGVIRRVRRDQHVVERPERVVGRKRLGLEHIEGRAADPLFL